MDVIGNERKPITTTKEKLKGLTMYEQIEKPKENESRTVANVDQNKSSGRQGFGFVDNRSEKNAASVQENKQNVAQMVTSITHTAATFDYGTGTDKVGVKMEAYLDSRDPIKGSGTGSPQTKLYRAVKAAASASMVRGHLLNHDLGGFGVEENLYPITSAANSRHKLAVENPVQKELAKAHAQTSVIEHGNNQGKGIYYKVTVPNPSLTTDHLVSHKNKFVCEAKKLTDVGTGSRGVQSDALFNTTIESDTGGAKSADRGKSYKTGTDGEAPEMYDSQKVVLVDWNHQKRSGKLNFDTIKESGKITVVEGGDEAAPEESDHMSKFQAEQAWNTKYNEVSFHNKLKDLCIDKASILEDIENNNLKQLVIIAAMFDVKKVMAPMKPTQEQYQLMQVYYERMANAVKSIELTNAEIEDGFALFNISLTEAATATEAAVEELIAAANEHCRTIMEFKIALEAYELHLKRFGLGVDSLGLQASTLK